MNRIERRVIDALENKRWHVCALRVSKEDNSKLTAVISERGLDLERAKRVVRFLNERRPTQVANYPDTYRFETFHYDRLIANNIISHE